MRVELSVPEFVREPRMWVKHQAVLAMALRPGSFELGLRRSEMIRLTYDAGEMSLVPRHFEKWVRIDDFKFWYLSVGISDAALTAAADGTSGEVELRRADNLVDARLGATQAKVLYPVRPRSDPVFCGGSLVAKAWPKNSVWPPTGSYRAGIASP